MAESEWSQLPRELLDLMSKRLNTQIDILRFRSVCTSWRSSVSPKPHPFPPSRFPIIPNEGISEATWGFHLSKRTIFRLGLPQPHHQTHPNPNPNPNPNDCWLIKVEEHPPNTIHLLNPLSAGTINPLPTSFPRVLDLLNFRVYELGQEFVLQSVNYRPFANSLTDAGNLYMEKVVLLSKSNGFVLLTIHVSGKLAMFKSGDKNWTIIKDLPSPYDDVILYRDNFYAVDYSGRTVIVDLSPNVTLIAHSVFGGDKKFLVESDGELLLVDKYLSVGPDDDSGIYGDEEFNENGDCYISERTVRFKVFKLDRSGMNWVVVKSLGDRVLFLGDNCSFSASASDFSVCKGNCIYFTDNFVYSSREEYGAFKGNDIAVFDLESGSIGPLAWFSGYSKLFWPPPAWVTSTISDAGNLFEDLSL